MRYLFAALIAAFLVQVPAEASRQAATGMTLISAKRGNAYSSPTRQIKARNLAEDAVLVLRLGGIPKEAFQKIDRETIYIMAGEEKIGANIVASGIVDGKDEVLIVAVGPRAMLEMTLFIGDYPRLAFKADEAIADELH